MSPGVQIEDYRVAAAGQALGKATQNLLALKDPAGSWCGDLTADSTLESDYILLQLWLYPPADEVWNPPNRPQVEKAARSILARQLPDGGFNIYAQGPSEISATVKAYFALKLAGLEGSEPALLRARERILSLGGIQAANSYVKINLSLFGLYPREHCPSVPPEILLLPGKFLYQMSSWSRAIVVPLAIVHAHQPCRPVPSGFSLEELFLPGVSLSFRKADRPISWRNAFLLIDRLLKVWEKRGSRTVRAHAIRKAEQWMLERVEHGDGLGAIYPPMMYAIMAFDALGYGADHPARQEALRQFEDLMVDEPDRFLFQPCFSPVWDTAIAVYSLSRAGVPQSALKQAADWLLDKEVRRNGDWAVKRSRTEPSGWSFEFRNEFYPDIDDTAMVLLALAHASGSNMPRHRACVRRGIDWVLSMQSKDGGWAAFDVDNNWQFLTHVPFADHNAMLDPTCADITGRVLEALCAHGSDRTSPPVRRGVEYLVRTQEQDGSWYGRWGVAYIYGTCFALRGLRAAAEDPREAHVLRAGEWLRSIQNADGGWGESCASYDHGGFTAAPSTPSQTAWALLGLMAGGDTDSLSVHKGIEYLLETQNPDGAWSEELATGTGFPRVFYLNYHLYRVYFPLLALAEFLGNKETASLDFV